MSQPTIWGPLPRQGRGKANRLQSENTFFFVFPKAQVLTSEARRVDMKAIFAEAEEQQASARTHPSALSSSTPVHRLRPGESVGLPFSPPMTPDVPHSGSPSSSRSALTPAWRIHTGLPQLSSSPPGRGAKYPHLPAQSLTRSPSTSSQTAAKTPSTHPSGAPITHRSWGTQSSLGSSPHPGPGRPDLGPVISPPKVKVGLTGTRHASYVYFFSTTMG
jgi:hypothetical protein